MLRDIFSAISSLLNLKHWLHTWSEWTYRTYSLIFNTYDWISLFHFYTFIGVQLIRLQVWCIRNFIVFGQIWAIYSLFAGWRHNSHSTAVSGFQKLLTNLWRRFRSCDQKAWVKKISTSKKNNSTSRPGRYSIDIATAYWPMSKVIANVYAVNYETLLESLSFSFAAEFIVTYVPSFLVCIAQAIKWEEI